MKKYWKSIIISLIIVLGVGAFYINAATSASGYPEFVIKKQSGDEQEVDTVVLDGYYEVGSVGEKVQITKDGSLYNSEKSFLDNFINNQAPMINKLQEKHRSFMRGKYRYSDGFYEDKQYLIYAAVDSETNTGESGFTLSDFSFTISILDKVNDDVKDYEIDIPTKPDDRILSMRVEDVQMVDGQLSVITQNYSSSDQIHLYTFDESIKEVESNDTLFTTSEQDESQYIPLKEMDPKQAHERIVYANMNYKEIQHGEDTFVEEEIGKNLISYNFKTKEKKEIKIPNGLQIKGEDTVYDGSTIYFIDNKDGNFIVKPFSLKDKKVKDEIVLEQSESASNGGLTDIKNNKVYALTNIENPESNAELKVVDLKTGKKIFEGEIKRKNSAEKSGDNGLSFLQMVVK